MKIVIVSIIFFTLVSSTVFAELTKGDLEDIRAIVKEEVKESEERLNTRIDGLDQRVEDVSWMVGIMSGVLAVIVAASLTLTFYKHLRRPLFHLVL